MLNTELLKEMSKQIEELQINDIMTEAHSTGFYYRPRIDQDLLFSFQRNVPKKWQTRLNSCYVPNWNGGTECKYSVEYRTRERKFAWVTSDLCCKRQVTYFPTEAIAQEAVDMLNNGEI